MTGKKPDSGAIRSAILDVLRLARDIATTDPDWRRWPQPYDYLPAELIAELIRLDPNWRTLEYSPKPTTVLRQLWQLEREGRVWAWGEGTPATATRRWALRPKRLADEQ